MIRSISLGLLTLLLIASTSAFAQITVAAYRKEQPGVIGGQIGFGLPAASRSLEAFFTAGVQYSENVKDVQEGLFLGSRRIAVGTALAGVTSPWASDPAPGTAGSFQNFWTPLVNSQGGIAFSATFSIAGGVQGGIFTGTPDDFSFRVGEGSPAPGTGSTFAFPPKLMCWNDAGQIAATGTIAGVTSLIDQGLWMGAPDDLQLIARKGDQVPGLAAGVLYWGEFPAVHLSRNGIVTFYSATSVISEYRRLTFTGVVLTGTPGALQPVVRAGDPAPGTGDGVLQIPTGEFSSNANGQVAYTAYLASTELYARSYGKALYLWSGGKPELFLRTGQPAPGTEAGTTIYSVGSPAVNASGEIVCSAMTQNTQGRLRWAIYLGRPGLVHLVARDRASEYGSILSERPRIAFHDSGQVAYLVHVDSSFGSSLWMTDASGTLRYVADERVAIEGLESSPYPYNLNFSPGEFQLNAFFQSEYSYEPLQQAAVDGAGRTTAYNAEGDLFFRGQWPVESGRSFPGTSGLLRAVSAPSAPVIPADGQPLPQPVAIGAPARLQVLAFGSQPLSYQWRRDGVELPGATSAVLDLASTSETDRGSYSVVVTNALGSLESATAALSFPPVIAGDPVATRAITAGESARFEVAATGVGSLSYEWQFKAFGAPDFTAVTDATSATFTISAATPAQAGSYRVVVRSADGSVTSRESTLAVTAAGEPRVERLLTFGDPLPQFGSEAIFWAGSMVTANGAGEFAYQGAIRPIGGTVQLAATLLGTNRTLGYLSNYTDGGVILNDSGTALAVGATGFPQPDYVRSILYGRPGAAVSLLRQGEAPLGAGSSADVFQGTARLALNSTGEAAFLADLGPQHQADALYTGRPEALQLRAQEGQQAPGLTEGVLFDHLNSNPGLATQSDNLGLAWNDTGALFFTAGLRGVGITEANDEGYWMADATGTHRVLAEGDAAPGVVGAKIGGFAEGSSDVRLNKAGEVSFTNVLTSVDAATREILYAGRLAALQIVARTGLSAGAGSRFTSLVDQRQVPLINGAGQVLFSAKVQAAGAETAQQSLWRWTPTSKGGTRKLIAREGEQAPGWPTGYVYTGFQVNERALNGQGQVVFLATVRNPQALSNNYNQLALYLTNGAGDPVLIARTGASQKLGGGQAAVVDSLYAGSRAPSGGEDGCGRWLTDAGEVYFAASLPEATLGVQVPILRSTLDPSFNPADRGAPPLAETGAASSNTASGARLQGTVIPGGLATSYRFDYGLTAEYGLVSEEGTLAAGSTSSPVNLSIVNLLPSRLYHYRIVASNTAGNSEGVDATFSTKDTSGPTSLPPAGGSVTLSPSVGVTPGTPLQVTFSGWRDPEGSGPLRYQVLLDGAPIGAGATPSNVRFLAPAVGMHEITARVLDANGDAAEIVKALLVQAAPEQSPPEALFTKGTPLPETSGAPAGATWQSFGIPTALPEGGVGFMARWKSPTGPGTGIFGGASANLRLHLKVGDPSVDADDLLHSTLPFASFREPVFTGPKSFAFVADLRGAPAVGKTGIWARTADARLHLVALSGARTGETAATFSSFLNIGMAGETVFFTAQTRTPSSPKTALGLWIWTPQEGTRLVVGAGSLVEVAPLDRRRVRSLQALTPRAGLPGEPGVQSEAIPILLQLDDGQTFAQGRVRMDGSLMIEAITAASGRERNRFGVPDLLEESDDYAVLASSSTGTTTIQTSTGAPLGSAADAPGTGGVFKVLGQPAYGWTARPTLLFSAVAKKAPGASVSLISAKNDQGLWIKSIDSEPELLAREGGLAPGCDGATFSTFTSYALVPSRGPIFGARLASRTATRALTASQDVGLWALSSSGALVKLLRTGEQVAGGKILNFLALPTVPGSAAQPRTFTAGSDLLVRVNFVGGSQSLMRIVVP